MFVDFFFLFFMLIFCMKVSFAVKEIDVLEWKGDLFVVGVIEKDMSKDDNMKFENFILKRLDF